MFCTPRMLYSDAPMRRSIDNWASSTVNASSWCPAADSPFATCLIALLRVQSASGRPTYVSNTPTRARASRLHGRIARIGCTCSIASNLVLSPNYSPRPPRTKSSPAPPGTTRAQSLPSRGTSTCARGPPLFSNGEPACRCSTPGPSCPRHTPPPRPLRPPCTSDLHCTTRRRLLFLFSCRAGHARLLSSAAPGIQAHNNASAAAAFLPR